MRNPESAPPQESSPDFGHENLSDLPALERDPDNLSTHWIARPRMKSGEDDNRPDMTFESLSEAIAYLYAKASSGESAVPAIIDQKAQPAPEDETPTDTTQPAELIDLSPVNALDHGLYRQNKSGQYYRPADGTGTFSDVAPISTAPRGVLSQYGYLDRNKGKSKRVTETEAKRSQIDEKAIIDAHAGSIVASYEARDNALASGMSVVEAQEVGAHAFTNYRLAEQQRDAIQPGPGDGDPSDVEPPTPTPGPERPLGSATTPEPEPQPTSPETKEAMRSAERVIGFFIRTGRAAIL